MAHWGACRRRLTLISGFSTCLPHAHEEGTPKTLVREWPTQLLFALEHEFLCRFLGTTSHQEAIRWRRRSSKSDVGVLCHSAVLRLSSVTETIMQLPPAGRRPNAGGCLHNGVVVIDGPTRTSFDRRYRARRSANSSPPVVKAPCDIPTLSATPSRTCGNWLQNCPRLRFAARQGNTFPRHCLFPPSRPPARGGRGLDRHGDFAAFSAERPRLIKSRAVR